MMAVVVTEMFALCLTAPTKVLICNNLWF